MLSGFSARKAPPSEQSAAPASADSDATIRQNRTELTLADIGARLGEDNEKLRNLLIDAGHRIGAIGDVKKAFRDLAEPIKTAIRDLEQERVENTRLRDALAELRTGYDTLHGNFSALEKRAAELEGDRDVDHRQLAQVRQTARGLENDNTELTSEIVAARGQLEQLEVNLAAAQADRAALSAARDEAEERHRSESYTLNLRIEALRARAATAEKLLSETRQALVLRTEELRIAERKAADAVVARAAADKTIEGLTAARDAFDAKVKKLEQGRASLTERSNSLAETLRAREASLAQAEQKIKSLTDRIAEIEVDSAAYRAKAERRIDELKDSLQRERVVSREALNGKIREFEQARAPLIERSNSLAETLRVRESDLALAEQKIKSLTDHIDETETEARAYRDNLERRVEGLNEDLQRERVAVRETLDGKIRELEQDRASLIERSNILAEALEAREASRADSERDIKSLTDRIAQIEAGAESYRDETERRIGELNDSFDRERVAARDALDKKIKEFEQERALLMEQSDSQAGHLKAREAELAEAERRIESLVSRAAEIEADKAACRTEAERRIEELNQSLQRERSELAAARDAAAGKSRKFEQDSASLIEQSNRLTETLKTRETALARAEQKIRSLSDRIVEIEAQAQTYRAKAQRRVGEIDEGLERERFNRNIRVVPKSRSNIAESPPMVDAAMPEEQQTNVANQPIGRTGEIVVFVGRKERKILVHDGLVPLFTIPVVIEDPDQPLGTHVFTAVGATENGAGIRWKLMTASADLSSPVGDGNSERVSNAATSAPSTATEALNRIQWPKEAADRLIEFLIPGTSLVISDDGLGPITRSWCTRIERPGGMRA
jgi:chromosome segregation ATPase